MSYTCSFIDEVLYGPEDVNEVVGDLVGAGVAPFISKESYNPSDLNSLTAEVVSSGVQLNGCKVSRVSETVVSVAPGIIYFGNGMRLKVTEEHLITVPANTAVTIYACYVSSEGTSKLGYTTVAISKSDYNIPLATISTTGTITDAREFAESKVATLGTNAIYSIPEEKITLYSYGETPSYAGGQKVGEIDLGDIDLNRFNHLIYKYTGYSDGIKEMFQKCWNFKATNNTDFYIKGSAYIWGSNYYYKITREFNKLIFHMHDTSVLYGDDPYRHVTFFNNTLNSAKPYFKLI